MQLMIECKARDAKAKPNALRREGLLPVVLYGHQGTESVSLTVNQKDADLLLRKAAVNNTMIDLQIPDMPWNGKALLREVQSHPWKNTVYHLSFFAVKAQDEVEVGVALNFLGEPTGVKNEGGVLNTEVNEVTVKCKAIDIPETIDVDVSALSIGDSLTVADLVLPEGTVVAGDQDQTIATVLQGRTPDGESTVTATPEVAGAVTPAAEEA